MTNENNGTIFYNNLALSAEVTASAWATGFGPEYIVNNNQGVVWRSNGITEESILLSFGATPTPAKGIVVLNHNLTEAGDTLQVEGLNSVGTVIINEAVNKTSGYLVFAGDTSLCTQYKLKVAKATGTYMQIGEIYLFGNSYLFERNYKWNYTYTREINRNSKETSSGQVYRKTRFIRKGLNLDFEGMTDVQKDKFETISESDYICFLPNGTSGELYYGIVDFSSYTHVYNNFWDASMTFMENPV